MNKTKIVRVITALITLAFFIAILDSAAYNSALKNPVDASNQTKSLFIINKGSTAKQIADNLANKKMISSARYFNKYLEKTDLDTKVSMGAFNLSPSMTMKDIAATITDPKKGLYIVTIPEGYSIADLDSKLVQMQLIQPGNFITAVKSFNSYQAYPFLDKNTVSKLNVPLEGYLFPDTYFVNPEFSANDLISKMLNNFKIKLKPEVISEIQKQGKTLHQIVTMASILEKEGYTKADFEMISGILWKRLKNNWLLGADATILYATGKRTISSADLKIDSPYNSRTKHGLPPGPIASPGIDAIMAAIYPKESPYWYYLTPTNTTDVIYATTNEQHNLNVAKYIK